MNSHDLWIGRDLLVTSSIIRSFDERALLERGAGAGQRGAG
ncbi:hypothetical protein [Mycobacterium numidiamassiliense]|jgi:hypothetical protein|nr:hypothetical protein [Mycobacterium numidiamassiliense]